MEDFPYEVGSSEKVRIFETELKTDLAELKAELEEKEIAHGLSRVISSVAVPKDVGHFTRERVFAIKKALKVSEVSPLLIQADQMTRELQLCQVSDYSPEGLPLLIHQHFVDRIHQLIQCKYMHLLRWKRFQAHTRTIEAVYPDFKQRLDVIMAEFSDCVERAQRLSIAHEAFLAKDNIRALMSLKPEDVLIYLRFIVSHFASLRKVHQYLRVLEWLPVVHRSDVSILSSTNQSDGVEATRLTPSRMESALDVSRPVSSDVMRSSSNAISPTFATRHGSKTPQQISSLPAAGGGLASDESTLGLPVSSNQQIDFGAQLNQFLVLYGIEMKMQSSMLSSDEMELYAHVLRTFRTVFIRQEHMRTFRMYDLTEGGQKTWGADYPIHALKKDSNWTSFVNLKPDVDPYQEKQLVDLRKRRNVDLLLQAQAHFIRVTDAEKVMNSLKEHASAVRDPPTISPINIDGRMAHRVESTASLFHKIYTSPELHRESDGKETIEPGDGKASEGRVGQTARTTSARPKRKNSFDYFNAVQLLGLDEADQESKDPASLQGSLLSFLFLRHLRIRDLQRTCLSNLNYFRSIERTLTINDSGLTCDGDHYKKSSAQSHRRQTIGTNGGLGSHQYIHNTPADYRMSETEFMQFSEIDNHDDFYSMDEGRIHVQDHRGLYVIYTSAIEDLKNLESDLLLVSTHYLEKDRSLRFASKSKRSSTSRQAEGGSMEGYTISGHGHQEIDRFGILVDLWTNEAAFLDAKKELMDCFMESYCHVFDRDEKRRLAQCVTNVMHRRPRFDFQSSYFVRSYRLECDCLRLETKIIKSILDNQIEEQREYTSRVCRTDGQQQHQQQAQHLWGMPYDVIRKQLVSVNSSRSVLKDVYLLEFHPSLAVASQIPAALKHAFWELFRIHRPDSVTTMVELEKRMLEWAWSDWEKMPPMGASYSQQIQKELFAGVFSEDPQFVCEAAQTLTTQAEQQSMKKSLHDRQVITLGCLGNMLEMITIRTRLIDAAWQSEILSKIYKKQMTDVGVEECHLFMRFVQFEFAQGKDTGTKPPSVFTSPPKEDPRLDRFTPNFLYLAINELDESQVGRFSFRNLEGIMQMFRDKSVENLRAVLCAQVVHKNCLICAIQLSEICLHQMKEIPTTHRPVSPPMEAKSEKSMANLTVDPTSSAALMSKALASSNVKKRAPQAFISLQLEKVSYRDKMLMEYVNQNLEMLDSLKTTAEMEKLKRKLIIKFCEDFNGRIVQHSLRAQIIACYDSILGLIEDYPAIRDKYFVIGEANERKSFDEENDLEPDPRCFKRRPRFVLSEDGRSFLNLWFVPHPTEILTMFRQLKDKDARIALTHLLTIVGSLHDILQFLFAHARLGSAWRFPSVGGNGMTADWGGTDAIGAALREIQRQMDNLSSKTDPQLIGRLLLLRRDVIFQQFDVVIRHTLREHFLATGNIPAFKAVTRGMHFGLHRLSNAGKATVLSTYLNVPEPIESGDALAQKLYPWRNFINSNGPFEMQFSQSQLIEYHVQTCLCGLTDVNRRVANAELVSTALLMEDVLQYGSQDPSSFAAPSSDLPTSPGDTGSRRGSFAGLGKKSGGSLSQVQQPLESYAVMRSFLLLCKRLERFKGHWVATRLGVDEPNTVALYKAASRDYRKEVMLSVMQGIARDHNQPEIYDALAAEEELILLPKGVSETESKTRQLVKLIERFECHLILEVKKKLQKELTLALAERAREENALPTDLWKRPSIRESFTVTRPQMVEDFIARLMTDAAEVGEDRVTLSKDALNNHLNELSQSVMARERMTYESYSSFYENLLRTNHQTLYQREREIKHLRDQLKSNQSSVSVEVQFQLAESSQDLVMEVIALRAKVSEMKEESKRQEQDVRDRIRQEYDDLVHGLVRSIFDLKTKFDEFRKDLYDDILEKINLTRTESVEAVSRLAQRTGASADAEAMKRSLATTQQLRCLEEDKHAMNILLLKLRAMSRWRQQQETNTHAKQKSYLMKMVETSEKDRIKNRMTYEKEKQLLQEQMGALRTALKVSQAENDAIRKDLEKEMREKTDKSHSTQQQALSLKQLEEARLAKIKKLCTELEENKGRLQLMSEEQEKTRRLQLLSQEKVKKDVDSVRKQLQLERTLKLTAFQCLEDLRAEVGDTGQAMMTPSRPHTAVTTTSRSSRLNSAAAPKSVTRLVRATSAPFRPLTEPRCSSSAFVDNHDSLPNNTAEYKKLQRPKTGNVRFRTVLANQLLNELDPPTHRELARMRSAVTTERSAVTTERSAVTTTERSATAIERSLSTTGLRPPAA